MDQWWDLLNIALNLWVPQKTGHFLVAECPLPRKEILHGGI